VNSWQEQRALAQSFLIDGQARMRNGHPDEAGQTYQRGLAIIEGLPFSRELERRLRDHLDAAAKAQVQAAQQQHQIRRDEAAQELHRLADRIRFLYGMDGISRRDLDAVERHCRAVWNQRTLIVERLTRDAPSEGERLTVRQDLLDLAILWTNLRVRDRDDAAARQEAIVILLEAEDCFGPSHVLYRERQSHAEAMGRADLATDEAQRAAALPPRTAWEFHALGMRHLRPILATGRSEVAPLKPHDEWELARTHFDRALDLEPHALWPNFHAGVCAYRLARHEDAIVYFSVCVGAQPGTAGFHYNRALARAALGRNEAALRDAQHARRLDPSLGLGAIHYNLALFHFDRGERTLAQAQLELALREDPGHPRARALRDRLSREAGPGP
jgi:tetratricopeptide (TPR) repeat protein